MTKAWHLRNVYPKPAKELQGRKSAAISLSLANLHLWFCGGSDDRCRNDPSCRRDTSRLARRKWQPETKLNCLMKGPLRHAAAFRYTYHAQSQDRYNGWVFPGFIEPKHFPKLQGLQGLLSEEGASNGLRFPHPKSHTEAVSTQRPHLLGGTAHRIVTSARVRLQPKWPAQAQPAGKNNRNELTVGIES